MIGLVSHILLVALTITSYTTKVETAVYAMPAVSGNAKRLIRGFS